MLHQRERDRELLLELVKDFPYCINKYIETELNSGLSPTTLLNYVRDFQSFFDWLISENLVIAKEKEYHKINEQVLDTLTQEDIENYRSYLNVRTTNTKKTIARKTSSLKSLFKFLHSHKKPGTNKPYIRINITENIKLKQKNQDPQEQAHSIKKKILIGDEIKQFKEFVASGFGKKGTPKQVERWLINRERDLAIISLFLGSGIRVSELIGLKMKDLDLNERCITVTRKGRDVFSQVYFPPSTAQDIKNYLDIRETRYHAPSIYKNENFALFVTSFNNTAHPISKKAVQDMVKRYAKAFDKPEITVHMLRHTCGTNMYEKTGSLIGVKNQLGHAHISTTTIYAHVLDDTLKKLVDMTDE